jgi:drug/metabolite transporter (DMT)-like permease
LNIGEELSAATATSPAISEESAKQKRALLLVLACTVFGAAAQVLIKTGATHIAHPSLITSATSMITNPWLFAGYSLYAVSTVLLIVALKDGELSITYPVIALTYVWVALLSYFLMHESMGLYKIIGLALIVTGVAVVGLQKK